MSNRVNSYSEKDNLQVEIAILQKKILAFKPCYAKLKIPALFGNDMEETIDLPMPLHLSITYGDLVIPKGTKLLVQTVASNYNEFRIIGFYDKPKSYDFIDFIVPFLREEDPDPHLPDDYGVYPYDTI